MQQVWPLLSPPSASFVCVLQVVFGLLSMPASARMCCHAFRMSWAAAQSNATGSIDESRGSSTKSSSSRSSQSGIGSDDEGAIQERQEQNAQRPLALKRRATSKKFSDYRAVQNTSEKSCGFTRMSHNFQVVSGVLGSSGSSGKSAHLITQLFLSNRWSMSREVCCGTPLCFLLVYFDPCERLNSSDMARRPI